MREGVILLRRGGSTEGRERRREAICGKSGGRQEVTGVGGPGEGKDKDGD